MAIYRNISQAFWTDSKIEDAFTPEDKYFYLYLLTNPHTTLSGCYEISIKQISHETGYNADTVERLINRFRDVHKVIDYNKDTKEILIINWSKYNWTKSEKFLKAVKKSVQQIKDTRFRCYVDNLIRHVDNSPRNTVSIPYEYGTDTTVSVTVTDTDTVSDTVSESDIVSNARAEWQKATKAIRRSNQ